MGTVAGCYVQDGKIVRSCSVRVVRDGIVIHEGSLASLKRFKDDAREVAENYECGLTVEKFNDIKEGDIIEAFTMEEIPRSCAGPDAAYRLSDALSGRRAAPHGSAPKRAAVGSARRGCLIQSSCETHFMGRAVSSRRLP